MSDIVFGCEKCREFYDRIRSLEAEVEHQQMHVKEGINAVRFHEKKWNELEAERDKLREALEKAPRDVLLWLVEHPNVDSGNRRYLHALKDAANDLRHLQKSPHTFGLAMELEQLHDRIDTALGEKEKDDPDSGPDPKPTSQPPASCG